MPRSDKKGFTLIEIMVAVAILSCGLVPIFQALFVSVNAFGTSVNSSNLQPWIDEKIWETKDKLLHGSSGADSGRVTLARKEFTWTVSVDLIDAEEKLYQLRLAVSWQEGGREKNVIRTAYELLPKEKVKEKTTSTSAGEAS